MAIPPKLTLGYKANFKVLKSAAANGDLAIVSAIRKVDQKPVALLCATQRNADKTVSMIPLAVMCEGNPFEDFEDPTVLEPEKEEMRKLVSNGLDGINRLIGQQPIKQDKCAKCGAPATIYDRDPYKADVTPDLPNPKKHWCQKCFDDMANEI